MTLLFPDSFKGAVLKQLQKLQAGATEPTLGKTLSSATNSSTRPRGIDKASISEPKAFSSAEHSMPELLGSGAYGTGKRCFLQLEKNAQTPTEGESNAAKLEREMSAIAAFQVIEKTTHCADPSLATEAINKESRIIKKLDHPNVIHALKSEVAQNVLLMTDGGTLLSTIQTRSDYKQLLKYLHKIKINCKNYSIQRPLTNHYQSIINVYQELASTRGAKNIRFEDLINTCKEKLPNVDMNAVKARFHLNTGQTKKKPNIYTFLDHLKNHAIMANYDPEARLENCLGTQEYAKLGMRFTLQEYLEKAKSTGIDEDFVLDFDLLGLFSHFSSKTSHLAKDIFKHCKRTYNPIEHLKKYTKKYKNKHKNNYTLTIEELQRNGLTFTPYFTLGESLAIFYQVCRGVTYLHENNIAHNDLHAGNIVINKRGEVRIIDFGCSWDGSRQDHMVHMENALAKDLARLETMFCNILKDHAGELARVPDGKTLLDNLANLQTQCTTAEQWRTALESFRHLFPKWDCLQPETLNQA